MATWHSDPALTFPYAEFPDDLQVMVHDGEPRRTQKQPEACFVRITGIAGTLRIPSAPQGTPPPLTADKLTFTERPIYTATVLNKPHHLTTVRAMESIYFVTSPGVPHPVHVTAQYLRERPQWSLTPCNKCGADQALDPMSVMAATRFPNAPGGAVPIMFSAFCPCGGTQMLAMTELPPGVAPGSTASASGDGKKPWWKFWN
ncbi:MAG TPA: hypothetical protein VGM39_16345 [Kofleriaceae bacterium]|jgi:hypothetical protein